jgi:hypothetical protein
MRNKLLFFIISIIFISGCVTDGPAMKSGLSIKAGADPSTIFAGASTNIYADVENTDTKTLKDVRLGLYYNGLLQQTGSVCQKTKTELEPGEFISMEACMLRAPSSDQIIASTVSTTVGINLLFNTELNAAQLVEMVTEKEYDIRVKTGEWKTKPKSYTYRDKNIELQVDFSDNLPIIVRPGKKSYVYFTVKNIGGGYISTWQSGINIIIDQQGVTGGNIVSCNSLSIYPKNNLYPRMACELNLPGNIEYISNQMVIIKIAYSYEKREDLAVKIVR